MTTAFPQAHTASYYAASINDTTVYPQLKGAHSCDVCIVGGGFTGVSAAVELAERGYKVSIVEANRISWGASGRNGGQLIGGVNGEHKLQKFQNRDISDLVWQMHWEGNEIVRNRVAKYNIDCDLKFGYIAVANKPRHQKELEEDYNYLQKKNFPHDIRLISREEMREVVGTDTYSSGMINTANGHLHPLNLCLGEASAAVSQGAVIYEKSPVTRIEHGNKPKVHTNQGYVECDFVILAGNAYHTLERKKLNGILFPAGSYIIATEPLGDDIANEINPQDLAVCDMNEVCDYFRLSADKRLLYGGRCNYSGRDPASIKKYMLPRMLKIYPQLKHTKIEYEWGGKIGIIINRIPHLGRIDKNIFYSQGYSGHGVNVTHITGRILAEAISGTYEKFDLFEKVRHHRIPGSRWFGNQMIALGMMYYRLMDLR
jgi:glycine/D-amino acid oxidase-like deaminating enzyme